MMSLRLPFLLMLVALVVGAPGQSPTWADESPLDRLQDGFAFENMTGAEMLRAIAERFDLDIEMSPEVIADRRKTTFKGSIPDPKVAIRFIARLQRYAVERDGNRYRISIRQETKEQYDLGRMGLQERSGLVLTYARAALPEAMFRLEDFGKTLVAHVTAEEASRLAGLMRAAHEHAPTASRPLPKEDANPKEESEKRLSLTLADVGLDLAVEKIARHFGANVVIASDLESAGIKVHLHVVDASLEQALQAVATMVGARLDAHEGVWTLSRQRRGEVLQFVDVRDIGTGDAVDDIVAHLQAALPEATIKRQGEGGLIIVRITKEENPTFLRVLHDLRQEAHRARVTREEQENEDASVALESDEVVIDVRGLGWEQGHNLDRVRRAFPGAELSWVAEGRILRVGGTPDAIREILNHLAKARKEHQANRIRRIDERALRQLREEADANTARQDRMESAVAHIRELETRLAEMSRQQSDLTNVLQLLQARKQTRAAQEIQRDLEKLSVAVTETKSDLAAAREDLATARAELEASRSQIRLDRRDRIRVGDEWTPVRDPRSARGSGPDGAPSRKALEALHAEIRALRAEVQDLRKLVEEALQGR